MTCARAHANNFLEISQATHRFALEGEWLPSREDLSFDDRYLRFSISPSRGDGGWGSRNAACLRNRSRVQFFHKYAAACQPTLYATNL